MNRVIPLSVFAVTALFLSSCGDDIQAAKEPARHDPAVPDRTQETGPVTDPHAKGASRTGTDPAPTRVADQEAQEDTRARSAEAGRTADDGRTATERVGDQADRLGEEAKGVVGQAEDPAVVERNRQEAARHAPDDTGRNTVDRNADSVTPMDQLENQSDIDITAQIRRAIVDQGSFSMLAKNIKIITKDGNVTLRGPVQSSSELDAIREIALSTRGVRFVDNELEVVVK